MIVERMAKWLSHFRSSEPVSSCPSCPNFLDRPLKVSRTSRQTKIWPSHDWEFNLLKQFGAVTKLWPKSGSFEIILTFAECVKTAKNEFWTIWVKNRVQKKKAYVTGKKKNNLGNFCSLQVSVLFSRLQHASLKNSKQICTRALIFGWLARVEGWAWLSHHITFQIDSFNETHGIIWKTYERSTQPHSHKKK